MNKECRNFHETAYVGGLVTLMWLACWFTSRVWHTDRMWLLAVSVIFVGEFLEGIIAHVSEPAPYASSWGRISIPRTASILGGGYLLALAAALLAVQAIVGHATASIVTVAYDVGSVWLTVVSVTVVKALHEPVRPAAV